MMVMLTAIFIMKMAARVMTTEQVVIVVDRGDGDDFGP